MRRAGMEQAGGPEPQWQHLQPQQRPAIGHLGELPAAQPPGPGAEHGGRADTAHPPALQQGQALAQEGAAAGQEPQARQAQVEQRRQQAPGAALFPQHFQWVQRRQGAQSGRHGQGHGGIEHEGTA